MELQAAPSTRTMQVPHVGPSETDITALANELCPAAFRVGFRELTGDACEGLTTKPVDLDSGAHFGACASR